ncbi:MAG: hypothetical protein MUO26_10705, partial [Methanotrichaceae archaeon]|nr:hypothetical protein [Methanotrichaceae archaeon]
MPRKAIISIILLVVIILMATDLAGAVVTFVGDPAVCAWSDNRDRAFDQNAPLSVYSSIDIFVRSSHDRLLRKHWDGTNWGNWEQIEINVNGRRHPALSSPSVVQRGRDRIDVFTTDGINVYRTHWDGRNWISEAIQNMGMIISFSPAAASFGPDKLDIFVIGTDENLWQRSGEGYTEENFRWERGWRNLGRPSLYQLRSSPAAASIGPGCIDVVVLTENGYYHKRYNSDNVGGGRWSEWTSIPGTRFGNDKRACVTAPILKGAPNCAGYADFFAVDNGGLLIKGDYHPSTTSALVGENIQQDIEYSRMGRAYSTTKMGSAPAVVGYWNPTPLEELTPPPFPQSLVHDPSDIWTIFYRS